MLNDQNRVPCLHQAVENTQELVNIGYVQACCGLIKDIKGLPIAPAAQFCGQLDPLGLTT